jgi:hypothetical protein
MVGAHGAVPRPQWRARALFREALVASIRAARVARVPAAAAARCARAAARAAPQCARAPTANHYSQDSGTIVYNKVPGPRALHILIQLLPGRIERFSDGAP